MSDEQQPETPERSCLMCERVMHVVAKVGPIEIKEPCPNTCSSGYTKPGPLGKDGD